MNHIVFIAFYSYVFFISFFKILCSSPHRETALLIDPKNSCASSRQWVALVVGHELAHQWFGNLVTMVSVQMFGAVGTPHIVFVGHSGKKEDVCCCRNGGLICGSTKALRLGLSTSVWTTVFLSTTSGHSLYLPTTLGLWTWMH